LAQTGSFLERHHFLLRRLHSLTGILPIGVFLIAHLTTNSSILWGKVGMRADGAGLSLQDGGVTYFHKEVLWINTQVPHLLLIEITLWASIAFHSILGVYYATSGQSNTSAYPFAGSWRYRLQRISGYLGILFIFYHVATLRWGWSWLVPGGTEWSHHYAASTLALALRGGEQFTLAGIGVSLLYFVGITMLVFHFANGLWTSAITWGLTISARAQKQWGYACAVVGTALMFAAWGSLAGFLIVPPREALRAEKQYYVDAGKVPPEREHIKDYQFKPTPGSGKLAQGERETLELLASQRPPADAPVPAAAPSNAPTKP
jgi:succinate dehydrogenase / fumarate reductase cytochrome b subunit